MNFDFLQSVTQNTPGTSVTSAVLLTVLVFPPVLLFYLEVSVNKIITGMRKCGCHPSDATE